MEFSAQNLCRVLRDRSLWPEGFEWDYTLIGSCAIGLAAKAFGISLGDVVNHDDFQRAMEAKVFSRAHVILRQRGKVISMRGITPEHIASLIEEFCGIEPSKPVSFTKGADPDSERWDNRRKVVEPFPVDGWS